MGRLNLRNKKETLLWTVHRIMLFTVAPALETFKSSTLFYFIYMTALSDSVVYSAEWLGDSELGMALSRSMSGRTAEKLETIASRTGDLTEILPEYVRSAIASDSASAFLFKVTIGLLL
jgi:hypothetical protein